MGTAERDGLVPLGGVGFMRAPNHYIEGPEEEENKR